MSRRDIIIAGRRFRLANAPADVINFADTPKFDFRKRVKEVVARDRSLWGSVGDAANWARRPHPEGGPVRDLEGLASAVQTIVLHADLVSSAKACFHTLITRKPHPLSTHFMINWDGTIIQGMDPLYAAFHCAEINLRSVGIDLNNELPNLLDREQAAEFQRYDKLYASEGPEYERHRSKSMRVNGFRVQSFGYTDVQYQALIELLKVLTAELSIPPRVPVDEAGEVLPSQLETLSFEGIVAHWHMSPARWDPGPGFDWERMLYGLSGQYNSFPVVLEGSKNIPALFTPERVREEEKNLYRNIETGPTAGTYPMARHRNWHGGVHLHAPEGTEVRAMFDGRVVAAVQRPGNTALGSSNFVLLRHDVTFPAPEGEQPPTLRFWSLYMHLQSENLASEEAPEWIGQARSRAGDEPIDEEDDLSADDESARPGEQRIGLVRHGLGWRAFESGRVATFPLEKRRGLNVQAGDVIGRVGTFGPPSAPEALVHVEVFTDDAWRQVVDMSVHRRYFTAFTEAVDRSLLVTSRDVLSVVASGVGREEARKAEGLRPWDIDRFFAAPENEAARWIFRRAITRHVSEWSDRVDWFQALVVDPETGQAPEDVAGLSARISRLFRGATKAVRAGSAFSEIFGAVLPFVWLTADVAEQIGIEQSPWKGVLIHFHPIYFLDWLTFRAAERNRVVARGVSKAELERRLGQEINRLEAQRQGRLSRERSEFFTDHAVIRVDDIGRTESLDAELDELRRLRVPGTWPEKR